jgi:hypothetical protein
MVRRCSAKAIFESSILSLDSMQCLLMVRNSAHNRGDVGSSPTAATSVWGWCNGNTSVSKTEVLGSSPSPHALMVL